jgi:hypothetical protein
MPGGDWHNAARPSAAQPYLRAFETYVLNDNGIAPDKECLADVERIEQLLAMLQWPEDDTAWQSQTSYMVIKRETDDGNDYADRPVLPTPLDVVAGMPVSPPKPAREE